jgi:hypothetical protein
MQLNKIPSMIAFTLACLFLQACSSPPREVKASVPLVTASASSPTVKKGIPDAYWGQFSDPSVSILSINQYQVTLSQPYTSALGHTCRALDIIDVTTQMSAKRIACQQPTQSQSALQSWYLTPDVTKSNLQLNFYTRVSL